MGQVFENITNPRSVVAGIDFTATKQFTFVRLNSSGNAILTTLGGNAVGVMQDKPLTGSPGQICGPGDTTKIQCGGTFAIGDRISADASGFAIASVTGDYWLGYARTAGAVGTLASILFQPVGSKL